MICVVEPTGNAAQSETMESPRVNPDLLRLVEAFVFASPEPVTLRSLRPLLPQYIDPYDALIALQELWSDRGVVLVQAGEGWTFHTARDLAPALQAALGVSRRLPRVAMEILVVIAKWQPLTRTDIEQIRGVNAAQTAMDILLETGLIKPSGRRDSPGHPILWGTTDYFLAHFGLGSIRELPEFD
jgi:segregation and condensation protein B